MRALRICAVLLGLALMLGEAYRTWGADRPIPFWMDDMIMGAALIAAAALVGRETVARRAFFTGAWGFNAGMLYSSFFSKLYDPGAAAPGNFDLGVLTFLIGVAFAVSIIGFVGSAIWPQRREA